MSVILLHTAPAAEAVLRRDHTLICSGPGYMQIYRSALTTELLSALLAGGSPDPRVARTEHDLGMGYRLRVTHDHRVMGPPGLRNLGPGEYMAPWGIWLIYKGENISNCNSILEKLVPEVIQMARDFAAAEPVRYPISFKPPQKQRTKFKFAWSRDVIDMPPLSAHRDDP